MTKSNSANHTTALQNDNFHRAGCTCGDAGCKARSPNHLVNFHENDCCVCNALRAEAELEAVA